jgi:hypothetical protein
MTATSNESLCFTALLILLGVLALYGGTSWLSVLVPAAIIVWLIANARRQARGAPIDARVDNRSLGQ